jgi:hypothetical protein
MGAHEDGPRGGCGSGLIDIIPADRAHVVLCSGLTAQGGGSAGNLGWRHPYSDECA